MKTRILSPLRPRSIHLVSIIILLWSLSDAIVSFYLPIQMQSFLHNLTLFGILFGFSSLVGILADPLLGWLSSRVRYIAFLGAGLLLSAALAITAHMTFSIILILWLMIVWGLYYELINLGIFSYVSHYHNEREQASSFGLISLIENVSYVAGPLVGGYLVLYGSSTIYGLCLLFTIFALLFLPKAAALHKHRELPFIHERSKRDFSLRRQLKSFRKVWTYAAVFFFAILLYNIWDSFVWTLVPIESIGGSAVAAGILTSTFTIPFALFAGYGGRVADRLGRNATFVVGFFVAAVCTLLFGLQRSLIPEVAMAAMAGLGFAFATPALMGETSQRGLDHQSQLGNVAGLQRIFVNAGFIAGPIIGGWLANFAGVQGAFYFLGLAMLICFVPIVIALIHFHIKGRLHRSITVEFDL